MRTGGESREFVCAVRFERTLGSLDSVDSEAPSAVFFWELSGKCTCNGFVREPVGVLLIRPWVCS